MGSLIYNTIISNKSVNKKMLALLVDPDKFFDSLIKNRILSVDSNHIDFVFVGGSLVNSSVENCIVELKAHFNCPIVLFPGNPSQVTNMADCMLYLSLISGRNSEFLIGQHVISAVSVKNIGIETIPTGYILIDGGNITSVQYISNTMPIPNGKSDICTSTAIAGELLGLKMIYLEAGSGASKIVSPEMIKSVAENIQIPIIVGGGIRDKQNAQSIYTAGADIIVIGTAAEENNSVIKQISSVRDYFNTSNN